MIFRMVSCFYNCQCVSSKRKLRSDGENTSVVCSGPGRKVAGWFMKHSATDSKDKWDEMIKQPTDSQNKWDWVIEGVHGGEMIVIRNPSHEKVSLSTSACDLTQAYKQHLQHKVKSARMPELRNMAVTQGLDMNCKHIRMLLSEYFEHDKNVLKKMDEFFAEPSCEGIEDAT